jgi:hypothetical protein
MSKGRKQGDKATARSMKLLPGVRCEIRDQLLADYRNSEAWSAKHLHIFRALHAHEKKHGCGRKFAKGQ